MSAYVINSKGVCMTQEMRKDRETVTTQGEVTATTNRTLNTMDELGYKELEIENKNLKNLLGEAKDKITVLQLQTEPSLGEKKDWKVTLSYDIHHKDTYLISNETREDAIDIAENQNNSPKYDCLLINEDESDIEDTDTTIKEAVFDTEKKEWIDKEKK